MSETAARLVIRERSGGRCEMQITSRCRGRAESAAHRVRRGQGGLWVPSNLLDACGDGTTGCHGWMGSKPTWAKAAGLEVPGYVTEPGLVPAWIAPHGWARGWWHLTDDGCLTECTVLERAPWAAAYTSDRRTLAGPSGTAGDSRTLADPAFGPDEAMGCDGRCVRQLVRA